MRSVDVNCDMGELWELARDGTQELLLESVSSVNISCGAHAGDDELLKLTILQANAAGVSIGAHPGYPDRENFGRTSMVLERGELITTIRGQLVSFEELCRSCGASVRHVKPHGALYNDAAVDNEVAAAVAEAVSLWRASATVFGLAGCRTATVYRDHGLTFIREAFADRRYRQDGTLTPRNIPGALIEEPDEAARQAVELSGNDLAETICVHSDTPAAVAISRAVRLGLSRAGMALAPP